MPDDGAEHRDITVGNGQQRGLMEPWKPGQSGNPKGRPKGRVLTSAIEELVAEGLDGKDLSKALAKKAVAMALSGNFQFFNLLMERLEGKVPDELVGEVRHLVMKFATLSDVEQALERSRSTSGS